MFKNATFFCHIHITLILLLSHFEVCFSWLYSDKNCYLRVRIHYRLWAAIILFTNSYSYCKFAIFVLTKIPNKNHQCINTCFAQWFKINASHFKKKIEPFRNPPLIEFVNIYTCEFISFLLSQSFFCLYLFSFKVL